MDHLFYLRKAIEVSKKSREHGNTPFGAILVDGEGNILLEQENIEITEYNCSGHAETSLMIKASKKYSKDFEEYIKLDLFKYSKYNRYLKYQEKHKNLSL